MPLHDKDKTLRRLAILAAVLSITSCTNTPTDLLTHPKSFDGEVQSGLNAQTTYRNIREAARVCLESSPMGTPVTVDSEFDTQMQEGQVNLRMIAQGVRLNLSIISVRKVSDSSSRISLYTLKGFSTIGTRRPSIRNVERWASGDKSC